jgi:hypothetical protein
MNNQMRYTLRFNLGMTQAEPECVANLVIHDSSWTWVCTSFGYPWPKLNLSVYLIWLFITQAEPECVAHLVIHDLSWTWVCSSFGYSWPKLNLSVYLPNDVHTQGQLESGITKWGTHSGSAWVMNNQMSYTLRFSLGHEPEWVPHLVIHDSSWTWVCTSFDYSWPKLNLSVYLIWLFMTQAEPECVPHLIITKWGTHSGSAWVMNNQMRYTLRFSLGHE